MTPVAWSRRMRRSEVEGGSFVARLCGCCQRHLERLPGSSADVVRGILGEWIAGCMLRHPGLRAAVACNGVVFFLFLCLCPCPCAVAYRCVGSVPLLLALVTVSEAERFLTTTNGFSSCMCMIGLLSWLCLPRSAGRCMRLCSCASLCLGVV